jgi:hypothetical protein
MRTRGETVILKGLRVLAESGEYIVTRRTLALQQQQASARARLAVLEAKGARLRAVLDSLRADEVAAVAGPRDEAR